MKEENSEFLCDHSYSCHAEQHNGISNEDIEKQYCEKSDVMQSMEYQPQPSFSHIKVPYDLELPRACATSYHLISPGDQYDDVVSLPHHSDWYINPIQSWIEATCMRTYKSGKNFYERIFMTLFMPMISHPSRPF